MGIFVQKKNPQKDPKKIQFFLCSKNGEKNPKNIQKKIQERNTKKNPKRCAEFLFRWTQLIPGRERKSETCLAMNELLVHRSGSTVQ